MKQIESKPELVGVIPADVMSKLADELSSLESKLLEKDPEMKNHLRESHRLLITYPETVHLLDDPEIALLLDAAQKIMLTNIVSETAGKKPSTRAGKAKPSVDDL